MASLICIGDSLGHHKGRCFSTFDKDNDIAISNCAQRYQGAWWYGACHWSNLNGPYLNGSHESKADGVNWKTWRGHSYSLRFTEMKIRPSVSYAVSSIYMTVRSHWQITAEQLVTWPSATLRLERGLGVTWPNARLWLVSFSVLSCLYYCRGRSYDTMLWYDIQPGTIRVVVGVYITSSLQETSCPSTTN